MVDQAPVASCKLPQQYPKHFLAEDHTATSFVDGFGITVIVDARTCHWRQDCCTYRSQRVDTIPAMCSRNIAVAREGQQIFLTLKKLRWNSPKTQEHRQRMPDFPCRRVSCPSSIPPLQDNKGKTPAGCKPGTNIHCLNQGADKIHLTADWGYFSRCLLLKDVGR